jgi:hypothetical protein
MGSLLRIGLYTAGALGGVYVVNQLRPVNLDPAAALGAAGKGIDTALDALVHGRGSAALDAFLGSAKSAGGAAHDQVESQVRSTVIFGVVGGCMLAGLVDAFVF